MTPATLRAGALAQRAIKLSPLRAAARQHRADGRIAVADAMMSQVERLEAFPDVEAWLALDLAGIDQLMASQ